MWTDRHVYELSMNEKGNNTDRMHKIRLRKRLTLDLINETLCIVY